MIVIGGQGNTVPASYTYGAKTVRAMGNPQDNDTENSDSQSTNDSSDPIDNKSSQITPSKDTAAKDAASSNPGQTTTSNNISNTTERTVSFTPSSISVDPLGDVYQDPLGVIRDIGRTSQFSSVDTDKLIRSLKGQEPAAIRMLGDLYLSREKENPSLQNWALSIMGSLSNNSSSINALKDLYQDPRAVPVLRGAVVSMIQGIAIKDPTGVTQVMNALSGMMKFKEDPGILTAIVTIGKSGISAKFSSEAALFSILRDTAISKDTRLSCVSLLTESGAADRLKSYVAQIGTSADEKALAKECVGQLIKLTTATRESGATLKGILNGCLAETMSSPSFTAKEKIGFLNDYYMADPNNAVLLIAKFYNNPELSSAVSDICSGYLSKPGSDPQVAKNILTVFEDKEVSPEFRETLMTKLMDSNMPEVASYLKGKGGLQSALSIITLGLAHTHTRLEQVLTGQLNENFRVALSGEFETYCARTNDKDGQTLMASLSKKAEPGLQSIITASRTMNRSRGVEGKAAQYRRKEAPQA